MSSLMKACFITKRLPREMLYTFAKQIYKSFIALFQIFAWLKVLHSVCIFSLFARINDETKKKLKKINNIGLDICSGKQMPERVKYVHPFSHPLMSYYIYVSKFSRGTTRGDFSVHFFVFHQQLKLNLFALLLLYMKNLPSITHISIKDFQISSKLFSLFILH